MNKLMNLQELSTKTYILIVESVVVINIIVNWKRFYLYVSMKLPNFLKGTCFGYSSKKQGTM